MLSKCANPECSEQFRYLHQGKIFLLTPTPAFEATSRDLCRVFYQRFWLCDQCCKKLKLVWGGAQPKLVPLPAAAPPPPPDDARKKEDLKKRAVSATADV